MLIDEFRIRIIQKKDKLRKFLVRILKKLLGKLDIVELEKCSVGMTVSFDLSKFVPDDKEWHYVAVTVDYWLKINHQDILQKEGHCGICIDGDNDLDLVTEQGQSVKFTGGFKNENKKE